MALVKSQAASTRDLKHRVLTCLNKLSDRDTHSVAATELESIARTLTHDFIPPFLSSISATDASDKSPVRKQCVRLISLLSEAHGDVLSPYLSKLLSAVVRRLRDPDSAVRSACVNATASISSHITRPPFTSIIKPLIDALVTEQDQNSQIGVALCLAAAIDASPDPDPLYLKKLLPRLEKLLKCDSFKAKPALLTVFGSIIGSGAASTHQTQKNLVPCLVEFIGSEDWSARKAAAEALVKLAVVEGQMLAEFKAATLKAFEAKKFDKVKIVRETMNQLVEAWKGIPDVSDEILPPPDLQSSSKEDASDGRFPPGCKTSCPVVSGATQMRKKSISVDQSALVDGSVSAAAKNRSPLDSSDKKSGPAMFRKLDRKKPANRKTEIPAPHPSNMALCEDEPVGARNETSLEKDERVRSRLTRPEIRRALYNKNVDDMILKIGDPKTASRVVPCNEEDSDPTFVVSNCVEDISRNHRECEDISLLRKQLVNIETQQSNLLDLLQKFMGSSQNGMHSLETRVHGLELALDEISRDLAVTNRRISTMDSEGTPCCKLPGADFLSPKFWRRAEPRYSTSQISFSGGTPPMAAMRNIANKNDNAETFNLENRRLQYQSGGGFIMNPLAEIHSDSHMVSEVSSNRISQNAQNGA